jgi:translocator assembly and maintenance protein 41
MNTCLCSTPSVVLHIHLQDLFRRVASLSYMGDVRMGLAEDSRKVERIVAGSYQGFSQLYLPLLQVGGMCCILLCGVIWQLCILQLLSCC